MEDLGSLWSYQESIDELKQRLLYTSIELESVKMEANEAQKKQKELLDFLKVAYQERDEAKAQLQKLLNKLMPSSPSELQPILRHHHHSIQNESPLVAVMPTKANSSITESNSLSDTYGSSPVDSFFDAVSSPDFSAINMADSGNMGGFLNHPQPPFDPANALLDSLVKGKILPQKGKLLQAVTESGPLLQTLFVAGPLPRWRNPPPLQSFKIPPFSINPYLNSSSVAQKPLNSSSPLPSPSAYLPVPRMSSQMCSTSMLSFSDCSSSKRQRFQ